MMTLFATSCENCGALSLSEFAPSIPFDLQDYPIVIGTEKARQRHTHTCGGRISLQLSPEWPEPLDMRSSAR